MSSGRENYMTEDSTLGVGLLLLVSKKKKIAIGVNWNTQ